MSLEFWSLERSQYMDSVQVLETSPSAAVVRKGKKLKRAIEESISEEKKVFSLRHAHSSLLINV